MSELARLISSSSKPIDATIYVFQPEGHDEAWSRTDLWFAAQRIPHVQLMLDEDGTTAKEFGAATSGHVFVYDLDGSLSFSGGITAGRGHEGDNAGRTAISDLVKGRPPSVTHTPVFGCSLFAKADEVAP